MHSSNKVIQGLWVGSHLSTMEQLSIKSFLANGHDYHLYAYEDIGNLPQNVQIMDANTILPAHQIFTYQHGEEKGSYSGFADLFRWHLLWQKGGWWADLDMICLKPLDFEKDYVVSSSYEGKWGEVAINCVLKLPQNSRLADYLCQASAQYDSQQVRFTETGPLLLQKAIQQFDCSSVVVDHEIFCSISWRSVRQKIAYEHCHSPLVHLSQWAKDHGRSILKANNSLNRLSQNAYAVHLWSEMWRREGLDKNAQYHLHCLYERLKRMYL